MNAPPCVLFEDEHLLVADKPPGMNTHAPAPFAGEGLYEWLKNRERRWAKLAILHRLDKETSGVMVFAKTALASKSLTEQFTRREAQKEYALVAARAPGQKTLAIQSFLARAGERRVSRPVHAGGELAETRFQIADPRTVPEAAEWRAGQGCVLLAEPLTGRTHQIRVHAADMGCPILGDALYGGEPAPRLFLHARRLAFAHPATGRRVEFSCPPRFMLPPGEVLRAAILDPRETDCFRLVHGASDRQPGWYVEKLGAHLLSSSEEPLGEARREELERWMRGAGATGVSHKILARRVRASAPKDVSPRLELGEAPGERFELRENGLRFEASLAEGYSFGLFLDQRDNRRRLITGYIAPGFELAPPGEGRPELLNTFAYTCGFSVAAAAGGIRATSLDLSKKYLDWGRRNFALNSLDPAEHDFIHGDAFEWLRRLEKKRRKFDVIILDPPTFSQSRESGSFQAKRDYGRLVNAALPLLRREGVLLACSNAQQWAPETFSGQIEAAVQKEKRTILQRHYAPQPPDFPISRAEPAYLKTLWLRIA